MKATFYIHHRILSLVLAFVLLLALLPMQTRAASTHSTSGDGFTITISDFKADGNWVPYSNAYDFSLYVKEPDPVNNPGVYTFTYYVILANGDNQFQTVYHNAVNGPRTGTFTWNDCTKALNVVQTHTKDVHSLADNKDHSYEWKVTFTRSAEANHTLDEVTVRMPTCTTAGEKQSRCTKCAHMENPTPIPIDPTAHSYTYTSLGEGKHKAVCQHTAAHVIAEEACSGGTATCTNKAVCSLCNTAYGTEKPHTWTAWARNPNAYVDMGHYRTCTVCNPSAQLYLVEGVEFELHDYTGGTCVQKATCKCNSVSSSFGAHAMSYTKRGDVIEQVCAHSFTHNATISLVQDDTVSTVYTGSEIKALKLNIEGYQDVVPQIVYRNNINVGTATGSITLGDVTIEKTFEITAANIREATVSYDPPSGVYDGSVHTPILSVFHNGKALVEGQDYTFLYWSGNMADPGTFSGAIAGKGNFGGTKDIRYVIERAIPTAGLFHVVLPSNAVYDGTTAFSAAVTNAPGVAATGAFTIKYNGSTKAPTDAGTYQVTVDVQENTYYVAANDISLGSFTIEKAENAWTTAPAISNWTYGTPAKQPTYKARFGAVNVRYSGKANDGSTWDSEEAPHKAGDYTATFTVAGTDNYIALSEQVSFTIDKATYNLTAAKWTYTKAFKYNGRKHVVEVTNLPDGVTAKAYSGDIASDVGDYTASVTFNYDADNYNEPVMSTLSWSIVNNWTPTEYTATPLNADGWTNVPFEIVANDGYKIATDNKNSSEWIRRLTYSNETDHGEATFYLRILSDDISLPKTVTYKLDMTPPTGRVELVGRNGWEQFLNTITFGLLCKEEQTVRVTASDALSGVAKIEYASADTAMTLEEVKAITEWSVYTDSFGVSVEDAKKFVYFVRITDKAGNVTYLSTDGAEYDTAAPVIEGIENGNTYYTTQKFTVTDRHPESVTINGEPADTFTLGGNVDTQYVIAANDKAGNTTTVTVTMKPIKALAQVTESLSHDNVTSEHIPALRSLVETLAALLADEDTADGGERETLEQHKHIAENLLDTLDRAAAAVSTEEVEKTDDITAATVTPDNKDDLQQAKAALEKALEDHGNNYTDEEKKTIEQAIARIDEALEVIDKVEAVEQLIGQLPDTIKKKDQAAIKAANDALAKLSEYEKSLVDKKAMQTLADATAALAALNAPAGPASPATGDNLPFGVAATLLLIGIAVLGITLYTRKRKV